MPQMYKKDTYSKFKKKDKAKLYKFSEVVQIHKNEVSWKCEYGSDPAVLFKAHRVESAYSNFT